MKKCIFMSMMAAAAIFCSCSSDDFAEIPQSGFAPDGTGYMNIDINMPTRSANPTRANDVFDDGLAEEYAVRNATLLLFNGEDEPNATFASAYDLKLTMEDEIPVNNQITRKAVKIKKLQNKPTDNIYAIVVLNHNGLLYVDTSNATLKTSMTGNASTTGTVFSGTINDFMNLTVASADQLHNDGFFMTNAILATTPGSATSAAAPALLAPVDENKHIYKTEADASTGTGVLSVFVERAVAKVSLTDDIAKATDGTDKIVATETLYPVVQNWYLQNVNASSYLVRRWGVEATNKWLTYHATGATATNQYRFAGVDEIDTDNLTLYRTYWGMDPNYGEAAAESWASGSSAQNPDMKTKYCYENTFTTANQKVVHTTYATIAVEMKTKEGLSYNAGQDFYCLNEDVTKIYRYDGMAAEVATKAVALFTAKGLFPSYVGSETVVSVTDIKFRVNTESKSAAEAPAGVHQISALSLKLGDGSTEAMNKTLTTTELAALNGAISIDKYVSGVAYYDVLIKHFGDDLTPWNPNTATVGKPYGDTPSDNDYLGRYGVLRNNWYHINVSGVKRIGSSTPPTYSNNVWDDDVATYLKCQINILSWAKRTQSVTLQ